MLTIIVVVQYSYIKSSFNASFDFVLDELDELVSLLFSPCSFFWKIPHKHIFLFSDWWINKQPSSKTPRSRRCPRWRPEKVSLFPTLLLFFFSFSHVLSSISQYSRIARMHRQLSAALDNGAKPDQTKLYEAGLRKTTADLSVKTTVNEIVHGESWLILVGQVAFAVALGSGYERFRSGRKILPSVKSSWTKGLGDRLLYNIFYETLFFLWCFLFRFLVQNSKFKRKVAVVVGIGKVSKTGA